MRQFALIRYKIRVNSHFINNGTFIVSKGQKSTLK